MCVRTGPIVEGGSLQRILLCCCLDLSIKKKLYQHTENTQFLRNGFCIFGIYRQQRNVYF